MWFPPQYVHPERGSRARPAKEPEHLLVHTDHPKGIAHVQLSRPPVNSLNGELLSELNDWLLYLGSDPEVRAVVISSAARGIFTAGLDFAELFHTTRERFTVFWGTLQELWLLVNTFPKPIVAAVNGNSPAGGCAIAMACDYRVMARQRAGAEGADGRPPFRIGLNESNLGVVAPPWAAANYAYLLGQRTAERLLVLGELPTADEALRLGLVDEVTADEGSCVEVAFQQAERLLSISPYAHLTTRSIARRSYIDVLAGSGNRAHDTEVMTGLVLSDEVQSTLDAYMAGLKGKPKKP